MIRFNSDGHYRCRHHAIGWERFEIDYCPILNLTRPSLQERECNILGSLCTPHDIWGYSYWGEDIQEGDILMTPEHTRTACARIL